MASILITQKIVIFNTEGKMLAIRRSKTDPTKPLSWDVPGGLVEEGEDLREAILRETAEEAGIKISEPRLVDAFGYTSESGKYLVCIGYRAEALSTEVVLSYEHDLFEWISPAEFLQRDAKGHVKKLVSIVG